MQVIVAILCLAALQVEASTPMDFLQVFLAETLHSEVNGNLSDCRILLNSAFKNGEIKNWAKLMLDATSKLQPGLFRGNLQDLGAFDECLAIDEFDGNLKVNGKYCLGEKPVFSGGMLSNESNIVSSNNTDLDNNGLTAVDLSMKWSICIPHICNSTDANQILQKMNFPIHFTELNCQTKNSQSSQTISDYLAICFTCLLALTIASSTLYDVLHLQEKRGPFHQLLSSFSLYTNGRLLFQKTTSQPRFDCLEGLKAITLMWVIYGHVYISTYFSPTANFADVQDWLQTTKSLHVFGAFTAVDTFFVLGGMVLCYSYLSKNIKLTGGKLFQFYLHRYMRLTPALAAVILFHLTLLDDVISGPLKPVAGPLMIEACEKHWWSTLLYIQNYHKQGLQCLSVSWYLAIDFQLLLLSPIILIPLKKHPKATLAFVGLLIAASSMYGFYIAWIYKLNPYVISDTFLSEYYQRLPTRSATWLIGVILGYLVYQVNSTYKGFTLNKRLVAILWTCSLSLMAICVFAGHSLLEPKPSLLASSAHIALVKVAWSIAVGWVVLACTTGHGGPINAFLSLPIFQILGRLTYCSYLLHFTIINIVVLSRRTSTTFSQFNLVMDFFSFYALSVGIAVVWTLSFEYPGRALEKCLRGASKKDPDFVKSKM